MRKHTLETRWTQQITETNAWQEYPRPTMVRSSYINLNGYWDYKISRRHTFPSAYSGKILVPFSPESKLSGVQRQLKPNEYLWYHRTLTPLSFSKQERLYLHFGDRKSVV